MMAAASSPLPCTRHSCLSCTSAPYEACTEWRHLLHKPAQAYESHGSSVCVYAFLYQSTPVAMTTD